MDVERAWSGRQAGSPCVMHEHKRTVVVIVVVVEGAGPTRADDIVVVCMASSRCQCLIADPTILKTRGNPRRDLIYYLECPTENITERVMLGWMCHAPNSGFSALSNPRQIPCKLGTSKRAQIKAICQKRPISEIVGSFIQARLYRRAFTGGEDR